QLLRLHDAADVIRGDDTRVAGLLRDRQHLSAGRDLSLGLLVGDRVQHHETAHEAELARMLDAERTHADHAAAAAVLISLPPAHAVVHHRALRRVDTDVAGA